MITITRRKVNRSRLATSFGFAWKWLYDVTFDGVTTLSGTDLLAIARRKAKELQREAKKLGLPAPIKEDF